MAASGSKADLGTIETEDSFVRLADGKVMSHKRWFLLKPPPPEADLQSPSTSPQGGGEVNLFSLQQGEH